MLNINTKSWHYRLVDYRKNLIEEIYRDDISNNLCKYFWSVVFSFIFVTIYWITYPIGYMLGFRMCTYGTYTTFEQREMIYPRQGIYTSLMFWIMFNLYTIKYPNILFIEIISFTLVLFMFVLFALLIIFSPDIIEYLKSKNDINKTSFYKVTKEFIKSKKSLICPTINFVD